MDSAIRLGAKAQNMCGIFRALLGHFFQAFQVTVLNHFLDLGFGFAGKVSFVIICVDGWAHAMSAQLCNACAS